MKIAAVVLGVMGLLWAAGTPLAAAPAEPSPEGTMAAACINDFAISLYAKLAAEEKGNLFFSPFSLETALAMTSAGARGQTFNQMEEVLHLPAQEQRKSDPWHTYVHQVFGAFLKDVNAEKGPDGKPRGYQLSAANALWGQKGEPFVPDFLAVLKNNYGAGLSDVDFVGDTEGARKAINAWVEKETRDKIKDLLKPGVLDTRTRLVLTNAIYFKGDWAAQFKKEDTKDAPFQVAAKAPGGASNAMFAPKVVPMMNRTDDFGYMEEEMFQGLKLPYVGDELSMVIFLPRRATTTFEGKTTDALADLEKEMTPANLAAWLKKFRTRKVAVSMPRFKTTGEFELSRTLAAMGMKDAFTGDADFSGMTGKKDLFISAVVHKAFVDVNEEGTEAAAATAVVMARGGLSVLSPPVFKADHPFLFLIRHEKTGAILFMGRLADPTK
jgi:serpin B